MVNFIITFKGPGLLKPGLFGRNVIYYNAHEGGVDDSAL